MFTEEIGKVCNKCYVLSCIQQSSWHRRMNSEIQKNTRFENIDNVVNFFFSKKTTFRRNSECERIGTFITIMDGVNVGQRSIDQVGEGRSLCPRRFRSCVGRMEQGQGAAEREYGKVKLARVLLDRHAVASGEKEKTRRERTHWQKRIGDRKSYIGKRGSEKENHEQPDKLRTTVRFQQEVSKYTVVFVHGNVFSKSHEW